MSRGRRWRELIVKKLAIFSVTDLEASGGLKFAGRSLKLGKVFELWLLC